MSQVASFCRDHLKPLRWRRIGPYALLAAVLPLSGCAPRAAGGEPAAGAEAAASGQTLDNVVLTNGSIEVGVSGPLGRITRFATRGGENLMWMNAAATPPKSAAAEPAPFVHVGGDKVWITQQAIWTRTHGSNGWPPDPQLDGPAWTLEQLDDLSCRLTSPVTPAVAARVVRVIRLDPTDPVVTITNTIERTGYSPFPVMIWSVSQVVMPRYTLLDVEQPRPQGPLGGPYHAIWSYGERDIASPNVTPLLDGNAIRWDLDHEGGSKVGTLGTWCAGVYDGLAWVQQTPFDRDGSYPDASNIQCYTGGQYTELETLSPQVHLKPGGSLNNRVVWRLLAVEGRDDATLAAAINALPPVKDASR